MNLIPCELKNVENINGYKRLPYFDIIQEFLDSDLDCAKVEGYNCRKAFICAGNINRFIKTHNMLGAKAISRNGEVYLIKTSAMEKK